MKKVWFVALMMAGVLATAPMTRADSFTFVIDGTNFEAQLTFTATQIAGEPSGEELITAVTGWLNDPDTGTVDLGANPATVVTTGVTAPNAVTQSFGGDGFIFENVLYADESGAGILDWDGLLIEIGGSYYLNLFSDGTYFYFADNGTYYSNNPITFSGDDGGSGEPAEGGLLAPEPSSLLMLGSALLVLALAVSWRARRRAGAVDETSLAALASASGAFPGSALSTKCALGAAAVDLSGDWGRFCTPPAARRKTSRANGRF